MPRVTRAPLLAIAALAVVGLAACSSGGAPGWTYDPTTPAPSASAAPASDAPSAAPSDAASEAPTASADGGSGGEVVTLDAMGIQWMEKELSGPADEQFTIRFNNQDAGTPHNVEIKQNGSSLFKGEIFNGVASKDYTVGPFAAGTYEYICTVHPNMVGTLTIGG